MMGLAPAIESHEPADSGERPRLLRGGIAREASLAGTAMPGLCPEMGGRPGEGGA